MKVGLEMALNIKNLMNGQDIVNKDMAVDTQGLMQTGTSGLSTKPFTISKCVDGMACATTQPGFVGAEECSAWGAAGLMSQHWV